MLFQEALFIIFIRLERLYLSQLKSRIFQASVILCNAIVLSLIAGAVFLSPPPLSGLVLAGYGLVGGNLGCALALMMAFGLARVISVDRKSSKPLPHKH